MGKDERNRDPSVRIRRTTFDTLQRVISESGWPQIDLLDQAILRLADYFDAHGKTLLAPLDYSRTYQVFEIRVDPAGKVTTQARPRALYRPGQKLVIESAKMPAPSKRTKSKQARAQ